MGANVGSHSNSLAALNKATSIRSAQIWFEAAFIS